jgi:hypothetical protein
VLSSVVPSASGDLTSAVKVITQFAVVRTSTPSMLSAVLLELSVYVPQLTKETTLTFSKFVSTTSSTSTPVDGPSPELIRVSVKVTVCPGVTLLSASSSTLVEVEKSGLASTVSVSDCGVAPGPPSAEGLIVTWLSIVVPSASGVLTVTW